MLFPVAKLLLLKANCYFKKQYCYFWISNCYFKQHNWYIRFSLCYFKQQYLEHWYSRSYFKLKQQLLLPILLLLKNKMLLSETILLLSFIFRQVFCFVFGKLWKVYERKGWCQDILPALHPVASNQWVGLKALDNTSCKNKDF